MINVINTDVSTSNYRIVDKDYSIFSKFDFHFIYSWKYNMKYNTIKVKHIRTKMKYFIDFSSE